MPKVDATRNYYADLQVTPASSADDVKKQYRKLGTISHVGSPALAQRTMLID